MESCSVPPSCHWEQMEQIRDIGRHYYVSNTYNTDGSVFNRISPQRTQLSGSEQHGTVHGMEFCKHKEIVMIFLACSADRSRMLPVLYIVSANNPRCFRYGWFNSQKFVTRPKRMVLWIPKDSIIGSSCGILT